MVDHILTPEQQQAFDLIESSSGNFLIYGEPGSGKSVLTNALRTTGKKHYITAAPTGLAALNVNGKTLHSLFGIVPSEGIYTSDFNKFTENQNVLKHITYQVKHLIIDEISMVRADMLDYIDRFCQHVKGNPLPFGGIQVIIVGDFFQLPPICKPKDVIDLRKEGYASEFTFDAKVFSTFKVLKLTKVLRQADPNFIGLLKACRIGEVKTTQIKELNSYVAACGDLRIKLCSTNAQADAVNNYNLKLLPGEERKYNATSFGYWPVTPVDPQLRLKEGAQVMVKKNVKPFVNGSLALIQELYDKSITINDVELGIAEWQRKEKVFDGDKWAEQFKASYEQIPVQLAWAISIHKSQGQSFDAAHIDPKNVFAAGQLYVALSRVRSLAGLSLHGPVKESYFITNKSVKRWHEKIS